MTEKERIEGQSHRKEKRIKDSDAVIHTFNLQTYVLLGSFQPNGGVSY